MSAVHNTSRFASGGSLPLARPLGGFLVIIAVLAGGGIAYFVSRQGGQRVSAPQVRDSWTLPTGISEFPLSEPELLRGQWTISGVDWSSEILEVKGDELESTMAPRESLVQAAFGGEADDTALCDLLVRTLPTRHSLGGITVLSRDLPDLRMRAFLKEGGSGDESQVVGGCAAYPAGEDEWTVVYLCRVPRSDDPRGKPCLLPGLNASDRLCARWSDDGQLQAELVAVATGTWSTLATDLKHGGWSVERQSEKGCDESYLCQRNEARISATIRHRPWVQRDTLILVRLDRIAASGA